MNIFILAKIGSTNTTDILRHMTQNGTLSTIKQLEKRTQKLINSNKQLARQSLERIPPPKRKH